MRVRATARSKRIGSRPGASTLTTSGVKIIAMASSTRLMVMSAAPIWSANSLAAGSPTCWGGRAEVGGKEGRREGALGEDSAEVVGKPERDEEGVGQRPCAEHRRHHDVAQEAGEARDEREPADRGNASDHAVLRAVISLFPVPSCGRSGKGISAAWPCLGWRAT